MNRKQFFYWVKAILALCQPIVSAYRNLANEPYRLSLNKLIASIFRNLANKPLPLPLYYLISDFSPLAIY